MRRTQGALVATSDAGLAEFVAELAAAESCQRRFPVDFAARIRIALS